MGEDESLPTHMHSLLVTDFMLPPLLLHDSSQIATVSALSWHEDCHMRTRTVAEIIITIFTTTDATALINSLSDSESMHYL